VSLNIGFFGSAPFVREFIKTLYASVHKIAFVVTSPDKPKGRGKKVLPPEVKIFSDEAGIPCLQPENIETADFMEQIRNFNVDLFLTIAYGKMLRKKILDMPPLGSFNLHFSLLPRWRGAAPVNHAVINGDKETGLTFMKMDEGLDTGDIAFQEKVLIQENDSSQDVFAKLISTGNGFLVDCLDKVEKQEVRYTEQDGCCSTYAGMLKKEDGLINWSDGAMRLHNIIRGLQPWPAAHTFLDDKRIKIWKSEILDTAGVPGCIHGVDDRGILVGTGSGRLRILELQEEGKNRVKALEFAHGRGSLTGRNFTCL
jgi:methionyl-tRNA formyltransferase